MNYASNVIVRQRDQKERSGTPSLFSGWTCGTELHLVYNIICSKPFTKSNRLSILVANSQLFILSRLCSIFQPIAFPFGRSTCALSGYHPAPALSGRLQRGCYCFVFRFKFVASLEKNFSSEFATLHLVLADRRATARTTTFR